MPYISTSEVKVIREELKREFPQFKFSVVRRNHSSVNVSVMEGPIDFGDNKNVNPYWIERHWNENQPAMNFLLKVKSIIGINQREVVFDGDYGSVPNYYFNINIGKWDKPYKLKGN